MKYTLRYTFKNDFKRFGCFHLLPEFEIGVEEHSDVWHIRLAFLTHEIYMAFIRTNYK